MNALGYEARLEPLRDSVERLLAEKYRGEYPIAEIAHYFNRYAKFRAELRADFPKAFEDLIEVPQRPRASKYGDRQNILPKENVEELAREMTYCLDRLRSMAKEPEQPGSAPTTTELIFDAGQQFDAHKAIVAILKTAKQSIRIVDNWIDESVLTLVEDKEANVTVEIVTANVSAVTKRAAEMFNKQHGGLRIGTTDKFHDRFIMVDGKCYHLGASIKDAGNKVFLVSQLQDTDAVTAFEEIWRKRWAAATPVA